MVIFHSYVSLPEGKILFLLGERINELREIWEWGDNSSQRIRPIHGAVDVYSRLNQQRNTPVTGLQWENPLNINSKLNSWRFKQFKEFSSWVKVANCNCLPSGKRLHWRWTITILEFGKSTISMGHFPVQGGTPASGATGSSIQACNICGELVVWNWSQFIAAPFEASELLQVIQISGESCSSFFSGWSSIQSYA